MPWRVGACLNLQIVNIPKKSARCKRLRSKTVRCIAQRKSDCSDEALAAAESADGTCLLRRFSHGLLHQDRGSVKKLRQDRD